MTRCVCVCVFDSSPLPSFAAYHTRMKKRKASDELIRKRNFRAETKASTTPRSDVAKRLIHQRGIMADGFHGQLESHMQLIEQSNTTAKDYELVTLAKECRQMMNVITPFTTSGVPVPHPVAPGTPTATRPPPEGDEGDEGDQEISDSEDDSDAPTQGCATRAESLRLQRAHISGVLQGHCRSFFRAVDKNEHPTPDGDAFHLAARQMQKAYFALTIHAGGPCPKRHSRDGVTSMSHICFCTEPRRQDYAKPHY